MHIKKFNENNIVPIGDNNDPNYRMSINKKAFMVIMTEIKEIMINNFDNVKPDWGTIGSINSINNKLLDILEGYNEDKANEIREMLK